ncbi:MAG: ABC transporter permease [Chitinophagia bacterium]|nr:ABC transporter permease [Chitinophagia bacterium]
MRHTLTILGSSIVQALQELRANKLRTFLSLLGITIGIFCIISVLTALDSTQKSIQKNVNSLGSDVLYVGRWPWPGSEEGEYKWWEYWRRPSMSATEARAVDNQLHNVAVTTLCLPVGSLTVKQASAELSNVRGYAVNIGFEKVQNIDLARGRFLSVSELVGGNNMVVIGSEVYKGLFQRGQDPIGKPIGFMGRKFVVAGVMKKTGQNMADFDFDNGLILPYNSVTGLIDVKSLEYNPRLIVKAYAAANTDEVKEEVRGIIRRIHKLRPAQADDFVINQLSGITKMLAKMFVTINLAGVGIGIFSLLVGAFGIANIMFVTVKERTRVIGLKKAIGAKRGAILLEFLAESVVLCLLGGLVGVGLVVLLSFVFSKMLDMQIALSMFNFLLGVSVSVIVGILSGFVPAWSASRLDPVVAIRSN